ncbi:hypothetical protein [Propionivibrio sp.]|uniref:hypothetical protein n=1 Tax=Propionivibrio sp. TaxID=2212460 RepID=UPI00272EBE21|nr:hypothetical protein [Propionivibrio sp.]
MTEMDTNATKDLIDDGTNVTIGKNRSQIAIDAAAEIEELCSVMRAITKKYDGVDFPIRGLSLRVQDLSAIIMGALCDDREDTRELAYRLTGERLEGATA